MCHALPAEVVEVLDGDMIRVNLGGVRKEISAGLLEDVSVGEFVVVHVGYALSKLNRDEAARTLSLMADLAGVEKGGSA